VPVSDLDIWRAANLLIKRHGADAEIMAAQRADEMLTAGDVEGQLVWKRILLAIKDWDAAPSKDDNMH